MNIPAEIKSNLPRLLEIDELCEVNKESKVN